MKYDCGCLIVQINVISLLNSCIQILRNTIYSTLKENNSLSVMNCVRVNNCIIIHFWIVTLFYYFLIFLENDFIFLKKFCIEYEKKT